MRSTPDDGRGDRAVEVGEPVVGQRLAGEVGDLRREVAGRDARPDRDVDEEVAPVPAAADPAVRGLVPAVAHQDDEHDRRRRPAARNQAEPVVPDGERRCRRGSAGGAARASDGGCCATTSGRDREQDRADDDRLAPEPADPGDDVDEVGRDVGAGHDRRADRARVRQVRDDPPDDDPARDEEEDRPDEDDRAQRHRPGDERADADGGQDRDVTRSDGGPAGASASRAGPSAPRRRA